MKKTFQKSAHFKKSKLHVSQSHKFHHVSPGQDYEIQVGYDVRYLWKKNCPLLSATVVSSNDVVNLVIL